MYITRTRGNGTYQLKMENTEMKSASLKSAFVGGFIKSISAVRENENEYLFVTVLNGQKSTNVYFGKKSALEVSLDDVLTGEQLKNMMFILATNSEENGSEQRLKIAFEGSSDYTNLASIFDDVEPVDAKAHEAEVLEYLKSQMTSREEDEEEEEEDEDAEALAKAKAVRDAKAKKAKLAKAGK